MQFARNTDQLSSSYLHLQLQHSVLTRILFSVLSPLASILTGHLSRIRTCFPNSVFIPSEKCKHGRAQLNNIRSSHFPFYCYTPTLRTFIRTKSQNASRLHANSIYCMRLGGCLEFSWTVAQNEICAHHTSTYHFSLDSRP
jgi:hypothetical protein